MGKALLIIDDDEVFVRMYQSLLENHGYKVSTAWNGEEGLTKALHEHPDLILLDIRMPKMDGMTMLKHLRTDSWGRDARVIILSNLDANDQILRGIIEQSPSYYLLKANNRPETVLEHIKEMLEEENQKNG